MFKPNRKGVIASVSGVVAAIVLVSSCAGMSGGGDQNNDLNNMKSHYPDYYRLVMNVSGEPTIGMTCIDGQGFATTSRDNSQASAQLVTAWNSFCKTQVGSKFSRTGNESDEPAYTP